MRVHVLFVGLCMLFDNLLMIVFPTNYLIDGTIFIPSLTIMALALCVRDMHRTDAYLFAVLMGLVYDYFLNNSYILYACIFLIIAFLVSIWKYHLFNSIIECLIICIASVFIKDYLLYLYAIVFNNLSLSFIAWINVYEGTSLLYNVIASVGVIVLYYFEQNIINKREQRIRNHEKIMWYEINRRHQ